MLLAVLVIVGCLVISNGSGGVRSDVSCRRCGVAGDVFVLVFVSEDATCGIADDCFGINIGAIIGLVVAHLLEVHHI